jgi:predicted dehydrogenase
MARATSLADRLGIKKTYADADTMLTTEKPALLCFATMPHIRLPLVALGLKHGVKAIALEKPLALSLAEAKQMTERCAAAGVKLVVCHQLRYGAHWQQARDLVRRGDIGAVHTIYATARPSLLRVGTHLVDYMLWMNDGHPGDWVIGQVHGAEAYQEDHPCPDHIAGMVQFRNGVRGILECGTLAPHLMDEADFWGDGGVTIYGSHGYVQAIIGAGWRAVTKTSGGTLLSGPADPAPQEARHMQALADWLDDPQQVHVCNGEVSYHGLEILFGMALSSLERRQVTLPITPLPEVPVLVQLQRRLNGKTPGATPPQARG